MLARNLDQRHNVLSALLLEPHIIHVDVSDLGRAGSVNNAFGGGGIKLQADADLVAEVCTQGLVPKPLRAPWSSKTPPPVLGLIEAPGAHRGSEQCLMFHGLSWLSSKNAQDAKKAQKAKDVL